MRVQDVAGTAVLYHRGLKVYQFYLEKFSALCYSFFLVEKITPPNNTMWYTGICLLKLNFQSNLYHNLFPFGIFFMKNDTYRIMVVDDEPAIAEGLATNLSFLTGYEFHAFHNSSQALAAFEKEPYHLVLTDLTMPDLNGFDLLKKIKSMQPITETIVITAHRSNDVVQNSHTLGAADIFYKPVDVAALEKAIIQCYQKFSLWQGHLPQVNFASN